jgi:hypothetical protein
MIMKKGNLKLLGKISMPTLATATAAVVLAMFPQVALSGTLTPGNLVVERLGDGKQALATSGNTIFVDEFTPSGTAVQSIKIDDSGPSALIDDGTANTVGGMTLAANGQMLCFPGYNTVRPFSSSLSASASASVPRAVGTVNANGLYQLAVITTNHYSGVNIRGAATDGNGNFWTCGQSSSGVGGGICYLGTNSPPALLTDGTFRMVYLFGTNLWFDVQNSSGAGGYNLGVYEFSGAPTNGPAAATMIVSLAGSSTYGLSVNNPTNPTVLYFADATLSGIHKWTNNGSGTWSQTYVINPSGNLFGLTVDWTTTPATIYATTVSSGNSLIKVVDNGPTSTATILATSGANKVFRNVAFTPNSTTGSNTNSGNSFTLALVSPTNSATVPGAAPTLELAVSNTLNENLTVTFYGRMAATPSTNGDFTIVALPDTQFYTDSANGGLPAMFQAQTDWIVANRTNLNVAFVTHLGDITDHGQNAGNNSEWLVATNAMYRLENPNTTHLPQGIPYGMCVGNHDQTPIDSGPSGDTTFFNQYFGASHFSGFNYYGGHYGTNNNNSFQLFSAGGMDFIIIHMEYDPSATPAVIAWANNLLQTYPNRRAIVTSHWIVNTGFNATFSAQGQAIYNTLRTNANLFLMLCGHIPGEGQRSDVYAGQTVYSILSDFQGDTNGGDGWLRYYTFSPSNDVVHAFTYSPWLSQYQTDASSRFDFSYGMDLSGNPNASFLAFATNTATGSNHLASCTWSGLAAGKTYQWYAVVSDQAGNTAVGPVWSFQTQNSAAAIPCIISESVNASGYLSFTWSSVGGARYRVQYSDGANGGLTGQFLDLARPSASETDSAPAGSASTQSFTDDGTLTGGTPATGARFYRVRVVQ